MSAALALAALLAAAPAAAPAAPPAVELSRLLLPQDNWDQMIAAQRAQLQQVLLQFAQQPEGLGGEGMPARFAEAVRAETEAMLAELLPSYQEMVDFQAGVLQKHYTPDELRQLVAFHKSKLGQKMIRVQPEVFKDSTGWSQARIQQRLPGLLQGMKERLAAVLAPAQDAGEGEGEGAAGMERPAEKP